MIDKIIQTMKRSSIILLAVILSGVYHVGFSQTEKPEIVTDRPDQTEAPSLVPRGGLQVELGTSMENDEMDGVKYTNVTYSTALIKYGVNENFELRLITEYIGERAKPTEGKASQVKKKAYFLRHLLSATLTSNQDRRNFHPNIPQLIFALRLLIR
jgi:hypothetical protein